MQDIQDACLVLCNKMIMDFVEKLPKIPIFSRLDLEAAWLLPLSKTLKHECHAKIATLNIFLKKKLLSKIVFRLIIMDTALKMCIKFENFQKR